MKIQILKHIIAFTVSHSKKLNCRNLAFLTDFNKRFKKKGRNILTTDQPR